MLFFFVQYWWWWLLHNPDYSLGITSSPIMHMYCIELNAHALIIVLLSLCDSGDSE